MKTRSKIDTNPEKRTLREHYQIKKKIWGKKWEEFVKKGHSKMTIMFIPHNEKRIFNVQISKFTISFFVFLFLLILMSSAYAVIRNTAVKSEEEKLLLSYNEKHSELVRYQRMTNNISDLVDDIKPEIEELYAITAGNEDIGSLWDAGEKDSEKELTPDERRINNMLPSEIEELRNLQRDIANATNTIKTVKSFVDVRTKVINETPSGVPVNGHITSLFGWRRSPFGFGREFHPGIDIAVPAGTPILATASGEVVTAGWNSGGYGLMVIIKHKYGFQSVFGHNSRLAVTAGQTVKRGQVIAYAGMTGAATGNHCHYELRLGSTAVNPYPYMSKMW